MVVGGSDGMTGAPLMVSHAAMRTGAGIVWCCIPGDIGSAARAAGSEVITKDLTEVTDALHDVERFRALVVGPGLGRDDRIAAGVRELVAKAPVPLVLDADGLNALTGDLEPLRARGGTTIVTPHDGEYARLAGAPVGTDRLGAVRRLAERSGAVVLLKGPATGSQRPVLVTCCRVSWARCWRAVPILSAPRPRPRGSTVAPPITPATRAWSRVTSSRPSRLRCARSRRIDRWMVRPRCATS